MSFTRVSVNAVRVGASQMTLKGVLQQVQCVATSSHRESTLLPTVKSNLMNSTNPSTFVNLYSTSTNLSMPRLSEEGDRELANPNRKDIDEQDMGTGQSVVNHSTSDPHAFHPDGSSSEQIVAGERSTIDPLMEKHKSENSWNRRDLADKGVSEVSSSEFQEGEMKSGLNSQIDSSRQEGQMSDRSQSGKLSKNEHGRQPSLQDIDEADSIGP